MRVVIILVVAVSLFCSWSPLTCGQVAESLPGTTKSSVAAAPSAGAGASFHNKGPRAQDLDRRSEAQTLGSAVHGPRIALEGAGTVQASASESAQTATLQDTKGFHPKERDSLDLLPLDNIKPLYTAPAMQGEGVWMTNECPRDPRGLPILYRTFYRPSVSFPNSIVYMMVVDMNKVQMSYFVGSQEPGAQAASAIVPTELRDHLMAVTNAMWMQRHAKGAGAIFRGKALYPMTEGMATLIVYKDGSVDVREWTSDIPVSQVSDARQLLHLIVKDGMVVQAVARGKQVVDSEIGLGFLLGGGGRDQDGQHFWYVAHRSGFGIRKDGNLVFAIGHHISTKDLAKAMVLAGCERAMHADANPDNIVSNLYIRDPMGNLVRKAQLSPEQSKYSLHRYDKPYSKDFFAFFLKEPPNSDAAALTRNAAPARVRR